MLDTIYRMSSNYRMLSEGELPISQTKAPSKHPSAKNAGGTTGEGTLAAQGLPSHL